jgi:primosomal protein N''|tara:strand:- start:30 stop:335 length:306 start_codon:yes stop_codon:yes gene_type:complete
MTKKINQQLIDNISIILKKSLSADATLADLREAKKAGFDSIFKKESGFSCTANTFQPYVEEVADDLLAWQQSQTQEILIAIVKKIEQLFTVLANFEQSIAN